MTKARTRSRSQGTIRGLEPRDRQAVRDICCRTAFRNLGSDRFFEDRELHADYWTSYYTDYHPEESWVIEQDGKVIGYFFGCSDQKRFLRIMARRIVPGVLARALWRLVTGRYKKPETRRYLWHMLRHGAKEAPKIDFDKYPAHYHCNVLRPGYGRGYYSTLTLKYLDYLEGLGIYGVHGFITEPPDSGIWQRFADKFETAKADVTVEVPTTLFRSVIGDDRPMVNRGWGISIVNYRAWIEWLRDTRNL
ncbi:MAG: hypothetical protein AAGA15_02140 [Pseudomonadota bacterium]